MGYPLLKMAKIIVPFCNSDIPMEGKREDTSANRKARKERARELTRQREQELRDRKEK